jgi:uncharacterized protein with NAD-binding domain and iron-sulfur cluster
MPAKEKIAILGGGPAGLAAAFGLSDTQELRDRYDITIYQVGWRAGGKCSTGRSGPTNRIEQNGTHYLFGCYDNCFDMAKRSYDELKQSGIDWFGRYEDAFLPRDLLVFKDFFRGKWEMWTAFLPVNGVEPGTRDGTLRSIDYVSMMLQMMLQFIVGHRIARALRPASPFDSPRPLLLRVLYLLLMPLWLVFAYVVSALAIAIWKLAVGLLRLLGDEGLEGIVWLFRALRASGNLLFLRASRWSMIARKLFMATDFECAFIIGLIRDGAFGPRGMGAIEGVEFRDWLRSHGAREVTLYAPFVNTWYDSVAAYENGDPLRPNLSAGVSVMAIVKAATTFKGHFAYQMRSEIGDTFIGPIFQCLRQRGVKIRFFHRIWDVVPGADGEIDEIVVERQVELNSGDPDSYDPFITVNGLKAWPAAPLWQQIKTPAPSGPNNIESFYTTWRGTNYSIYKGTDFDRVILALPNDTLPTYCSKIVQSSPAWQAMTSNLTAVETQSMRLWFHTTLEQIGWTLPTPILSGYMKPFSTWEDNGELVKVETWPKDNRPHAMATVFGALPAPPVAPPYTDVAYPCIQQASADANALEWVRNAIGSLWPGAASIPNPIGVDWAQLVCLGPQVGSARLQSQYVRANCGPIERYTMARADTMKYRLATDQSGYRNLFLAGDWIENHFLIGSVEGAIMGGLQASRAISGSPRVISGEVNGL